MDMYLFIESSIRGGLSQISKRYAQANNKYMSDYDKSLMDSYILYLDLLALVIRLLDFALEATSSSFVFLLTAERDSGSSTAPSSIICWF